jgi:uncharacterized protein with von Willebrand factor type A (vWA) domain
VSDRGAGAARSADDFARLGRNLIVFGRALRENGFRAQPDRMVLLAQAIDAVGLRSRSDVKDAARSVLSRNKEEHDRFDAAFDAFWTDAHAEETGDRPERDRSDAGAPRAGPGDEPPRAARTAGDVRSSAPSADRDPEVEHEGKDALHLIDGDRSFTYSFTEGLYNKDFSKLTDREMERARELTKRQAWDLGRRRTRRMKRGRGGGAFDAARTLRASLRRGGEILALTLASAGGSSAISSSCATSPDRWTATPGCCCSSCTRSGMQSATSRRSCSGPG